MDHVVKKYSLSSRQQESDMQAYWKKQSIKHKMEVVESLRMDAIKMGLFQDIDINETEPRLRRVYNVTKQA